MCVAVTSVSEFARANASRPSQVTPDLDLLLDLLSLSEPWPSGSWPPGSWPPLRLGPEGAILLILLSRVLPRALRPGLSHHEARGAQRRDALGVAVDKATLLRVLRRGGL